MSGFVRTKRVTDPLDDKVKARIVGQDRFEPVSVSSGSEHSAEILQQDDESLCLSDLVHEFFESDGAGVQSPENDPDSDHIQSMSDLIDSIDDLMNSMVINHVDSFKKSLVGRVSQATKVFAFAITNKSLFRRNVVAYLRKHGFDAAICKTKWQSSGRITAGNYEFIDVVRSDSSTGKQQIRYFIDLEFAGEFEIARSTNQYEAILQRIPRVFVGRSEDLKRIVKVMSEAARRSLKSRGLCLSPWRKNRFMQNKWFGPYRRTTNTFPANSLLFPSPAKPLFSVKCRLVGFDVVNSRFVCSGDNSY